MAPGKQSERQKKKRMRMSKMRSSEAVSRQDRACDVAESVPKGPLLPWVCSHHTSEYDGGVEDVWNIGNMTLLIWEALGEVEVLLRIGTCYRRYYEAGPNWKEEFGCSSGVARIFYDMNEEELVLEVEGYGMFGWYEVEPSDAETPFKDWRDDRLAWKEKGPTPIPARDEYIGKEFERKARERAYAHERNQSKIEELNEDDIQRQSQIDFMRNELMKSATLTNLNSPYTSWSWSSVDTKKQSNTSDDIDSILNISPNFIFESDHQATAHNFFDPAHMFYYDGSPTFQANNIPLASYSPFSPDSSYDDDIESLFNVQYDYLSEEDTNETRALATQCPQISMIQGHVDLKDLSISVASVSIVDVPRVSVFNTNEHLMSFAYNELVKRDIESHSFAKLSLQGREHRLTDKYEDLMLQNIGRQRSLSSNTTASDESLIVNNQPKVNRCGYSRQSHMPCISEEYKEKQPVAKKKKRVGFLSWFCF